MVVEKLYHQNNLAKRCYSGCRKTLFDQISKQSKHNKQNDRQNSNANMRDPVRYAIVDSLDCTLSVLEIIVTKVVKKHAESVLPVVEGFLGYNF